MPWKILSATGAEKEFVRLVDDVENAPAGGAQGLRQLVADGHDVAADAGVPRMHRVELAAALEIGDHQLPAGRQRPRAAAQEGGGILQMRVQAETQHQIPGRRIERRVLGLAVDRAHVGLPGHRLRAARHHAGTRIQREDVARGPHPLRQARGQRPRPAAGLEHALAAQIAQATAQTLEPGLVLRLEGQRGFLAGQRLEKGLAIHDGRG